jgi:SM-20-related protein
VKDWYALLSFVSFFQMKIHTEQQWINWVDVLANEDLVIIDEFLSDDYFQKLRTFLLKRLHDDAFDKAGIGSLNDYKIERSVRGDFVFWLDKARDSGISGVFDLLESVKSILNRLCFLSLSGYEFHLAHYPAGAFYKRHLDQFKERQNRMITLIIYLNEHWQKGDGGELKVYRADGSSFCVDPKGNRCLIFKSAVIEHEVLATNKSRYTLTGWFLYQPAALGYLLG